MFVALAYQPVPCPLAQSAVDEPQVVFMAVGFDHSRKLGLALV